MVGPLILMFVMLPLAELFLLIRIGRVIGPWYTVLGLMAVALVGAALAKQQGARVMRAWRSALEQGRMPEEGVLGGFLILVGGVLLVTPGVLTDVMGLFLLLPWTRRVVMRVMRHSLEQQLLKGTVRLHTVGGGFSPPAGADRARPPRSPGPAGPYRPGDVIDTEGEEI